MSTESANNFILAIPKTLYVDEDYSVKSPLYNSVESLTASLKTYGPLVAEGRLGPKAYAEAPIKLQDKVSDHVVYAWKPTAEKVYCQSHVILLGTQIEAQMGAKSRVYYTMAKDITENEEINIRAYQPLPSDSKIYVMSYENFLKRGLSNLHPICPHGEWLFTTPPNDFLDGDATEAKCKKIGQEIFDSYKARASCKSNAGMEALIRICEVQSF